MTTSLNGIFAPPRPHLKNFVIENRKKIRQMSSKSMRSDATYSSVGSLLNKSPVRTAKPKPAPQPADGVEFPRLRTKLFINCRNQASQTEGGIAEQLPDLGTLENVDSSSSDRPLEKSQNVIFEEESSPFVEQVVHKPKEVKNKTLISKDTVEQAKNGTRRHNTSSAVSSALCEKAPSSRRVPASRYLRKSKPEPPIVTDPDCPPGHAALSEIDRLEMLEKLNQGYHERIFDLNKLPVGADTLRVRTMRIDLEKQLEDIEANLKIFSKPKVYVKLKT